MPTRILARDQQRQLERLGEAEPANLLRSRLSDEQIAALERSTKDRPRVPLRGRCSSSPGPGRRSQSKARQASLRGFDAAVRERFEQRLVGRPHVDALSQRPAAVRVVASDEPQHLVARSDAVTRTAAEHVEDVADGVAGARRRDDASLIGQT
jgi:hypothetical protein